MCTWWVSFVVDGVLNTPLLFVNCLVKGLIRVYVNVMNDSIKKIDGWLKKTGMSESRLGLLSAANSAAVKAIRRGTARVVTLQAVLQYIEDHPPAR